MLGIRPRKPRAYVLVAKLYSGETRKAWVDNLKTNPPHRYDRDSAEGIMLLTMAHMGLRVQSHTVHEI